MILRVPGAPAANQTACKLSFNKNRYTSVSNKLKVLIALAAALSIVSCSRADSINIAGSTTVLPVVSVAAEHYRVEHPDVNIVVNAGGSGVGVNQLGAGTIDIGMISRHITSGEIGKYPDVKFVTHAIGKDAVVPVVSSEIYDAGVTALNVEQIGKIYTGEIRNWEELGGPDRNILVVDKEQSRGTRHVFMEIVLGDKEAAAPGADLVLGSNNEEQTAIVQSDAAIGMLSHAWLNDDVRGLAIILQDGSVVEPTLETITNNSFPITRDLLIVTNGEPQGTVRDFIDFIYSQAGQAIVEEAGYVSLAR